MKKSPQPPKKAQPSPVIKPAPLVIKFAKERIVGLDEVGRGALAGPVVVAAVEITTRIQGVTDSKQMSAAQRQYLAGQIIKEAKQLSIGQATNQEIDQLGIIAALKKAYAISLQNINAGLFLTDAWSLDRRPFLRALKGDQLFYQVAAASIVAKVFRDQLMMLYDQFWPEYGWKNNVGYGTPTHIATINKIGLSPLHRKSFCP
ncbi:MAG: ribonuclease HII [Patescibacteria group bacterium]